MEGEGEDEGGGVDEGEGEGEGQGEDAGEDEGEGEAEDQGEGECEWVSGASDPKFVARDSVDPQSGTVTPVILTGMMSSRYGLKLCVSFLWPVSADSDPKSVAQYSVYPQSVDPESVDSQSVNPQERMGRHIQNPLRKCVAVCVNCVKSLLVQNFH